MRYPTVGTKDTLEKSILWIFQDLLVIGPNQTEMMLCIEIFVEHCRGLIFPPTQGQEPGAKDWK